MTFQDQSSVSAAYEGDDETCFLFVATSPCEDWTVLRERSVEEAKVAFAAAGAALGRDASMLTRMIGNGGKAIDAGRDKGITHRWTVDMRAVRKCPEAEGIRIKMPEDKARILINAIHQAGLWSCCGPDSTNAFVTTKAGLTPRGSAIISLEATTYKIGKPGRMPGTAMRTVPYADRPMAMAAMAIALAHPASSGVKSSGQFEMTSSVHRGPSATLDAARQAMAVERAAGIISAYRLPIASPQG